MRITFLALLTYLSTNVSKWVQLKDKTLLHKFLYVRVRFFFSLLWFLTLPKKDDFFSFSGEVGAEVVLLLFWKALPDVLLLIPCSIWDPGLGGGPSVFDWSPCTLDKFEINFNVYNPFVRILMLTMIAYISVFKNYGLVFFLRNWKELFTKQLNR